MKRAIGYMNIKNLLAQAMNPSRFKVMAKKIGLRIADQSGELSREENVAWIKANTSSFETLAKSIDPNLWEESQQVSRRLEEHANQVLAAIEYELGGGGVYPFLYFLTRHLQPMTVVETGVAAGYSSAAFLAALQANGKGRLYSSDFPYFRLPRPERFIGVVVDESLRNRWDLLIEGDEANLPAILARVDHVDLFHYDSDKSYRGRNFALSLVGPKLVPGAVILMDDIQDNSYFHDYVTQRGNCPWRIFEFHGKYVGMIGELVRPPE